MFLITNIKNLFKRIIKRFTYCEFSWKCPLYQNSFTCHTYDAENGYCNKYKEYLKIKNDKEIKRKLSMIENSKYHSEKVSRN